MVLKGKKEKDNPNWRLVHRSVCFSGSCLRDGDSADLSCETLLGTCQGGLGIEQELKGED